MSRPTGRPGKRIEVRNRKDPASTRIAVPLRQRRRSDWVFTFFVRLSTANNCWPTRKRNGSEDQKLRTADGKKSQALSVRKRRQTAGTWCWSFTRTRILTNPGTWPLCVLPKNRQRLCNAMALKSFRPELTTITPRPQESGFRAIRMPGRTVSGTLCTNSKSMKGRMKKNQSSQYIETIVIGGGQAGLCVGYHLAKQGLPFRILEASRRIGDAWRNRWDSLRLFTPARYDALPGLRFPARGDEFPSKDEMADYLESYARYFRLPVQMSVKVDRLWKEGGRFVMTAGTQRFECENVVVAMANYQVRRLPSFAKDIDTSIRQLHSCE